MFLALDMQRAALMLPLILVCLSGPIALASEQITATQTVTDAPAPITTVAAAAAALEVVRMPADFRAPSRGVALPILYSSLALLQSYDAVSTLRGVRAGSVEVNPVMAGVSRSPAAMWAVKVGVTTASIVAAERLWRQHHRGQAIAVMGIANGVMAAVALHNAAVIKGVR